MCILYARQGLPLNQESFIRIASKLCGKQLTKGFFYRFMNRHKSDLVFQKGVLTSPTRSRGDMSTLAEAFISELDPLITKGVVNAGNMFVFDETIVGGSASLPKVIGEATNVGDGNTHVVRQRERALCSFIPFSQPDGSTPFCAYVFKEAHCRRHAQKIIVDEPERRGTRRKEPHRVFLASESGYLTTELFRIVMDQFASWWTVVCGAKKDCYLFSDQLAIHKNKDIVREARTRGIHMHNIMPGSSHWFQVHDHLPFCLLKKKLTEGTNRVGPLSSLPAEERRRIMSAVFYKAEEESFAGNVVRSSFGAVGLWPWNPGLIRELCEKNSPIQNLGTIDRVANIARAIAEFEDEKQTTTSELLRTLKSRTIQLPARRKEGEVGKRTRDTTSSQERCQLETAPKRKRVVAPKHCSVLGCLKSCKYINKKWRSCPVCQQLFCTEHLSAFRRHPCSPSPL
jgi:hypothetical protein